MKKYRRLTRADRITIQKRLEQKKNKSEIAEEIGVHRCTISREIRRHQNCYGKYKWLGAHRGALARRRSKLEYKRKIEGPLEDLVTEWISNELSPEQVSQRLKLENAQWAVSHETIYRWIYNIARDLIPHLRWGRRSRRKRTGKQRRSLMDPNRKMIGQRPKAANTRDGVGHWERDLIIGTKSGPALLVVQDRKTRFTIIKKVRNKATEVVNAATVQALQGHKVLTCTNDNGIEFTEYKSLEKNLNAEIYFCQPYSSWERGTVENTNGLIRQYFPKRTDFQNVPDEYIKLAEERINNRPKKVLGFRTPKEVHENKNYKMVRSESTYRKRISKRIYKECKELLETI